MFSDRYLRVIRMANLMFVRCGNTNYFPMISHFIMYMACCSEAEFELTAKKVFTKSTRYGCRMFSDLFVEITIRYIRAVSRPSVLFVWVVEMCMCVLT